MKCLYCGKEIKANSFCNWHKTCIKKFFGTDTIPDIEIDEKTLKALAIENTNKGITVTGVQKKLSVHLISLENKPRLTLVGYPTGYILKPQVEEYEALPEAEQLIMSMADITGIATVPHALIGNGKNKSYITKRIDRVFEKNKIKMLAMEDFCQLDLRLTQDKYKGSYERCAKIIKQYSKWPQFDLTELFLRLVFSFVVGNSDMHLKNFSLIEGENNSYVLSKAYDLLPVNIILPEDKEEFALTLNGKKAKINRDDFMIFANHIGISPVSAKKIIDKVISLKLKYIQMCKESLLPDYMKSSLITLMESRFNILENN